MKLDMNKLDGGIKEIKLIGRLDVKGTGQIDDAFAIQAITRKAGVLVDMSEVEFIASIGMRMLLGNARALGKRGGKMVLLKPTEMVKNVLKSAGIDELIPVYDDFEAACADLRAAVPE